MNDRRIFPLSFAPLEQSQPGEEFWLILFFDSFLCYIQINDLSKSFSPRELDDLFRLI